MTKDVTDMILSLISQMTNDQSVIKQVNHKIFVSLKSHACLSEPGHLKELLTDIEKISKSIPIRQ